MKFGFIPLSDCAPLVIAQEKGFFADEGLDVSLSAENSWAQIRDRVALGELDGAHMLAPMVVASAVGLDAIGAKFVTAFSMNLNGNAITVSEKLFEEMRAAEPGAMRERPLTARALRPIARARNEAEEMLTFAMVFPYSSHNYELRYWLASAGIHPDKDVRLVVVPPARVVEHLRAGIIDGFCVGEPWNAEAVSAGIGRTLVTSHELWNNGPEKVFGVTSDWAAAYPGTHQAALRALIRASRWLDAPGGRDEAADILAHPDYVGLPAERLRPSLNGSRLQTSGEAIVDMPDFVVFHRYAANFPWLSHASWFICQMYRWGQMNKPVDIRAAAQAAYLPDTYRQAAAALGVPYPTVNEKVEGGHRHAWALIEASEPIGFGPDAFIDGKIFDPSDPLGYLLSLEQHNIRVPINELVNANEHGQS